MPDPYRLPRRLAVLAAVLLAATAFPAVAQQTPRLKALVTVEGDTVRLGDLVDGAGDAASRIIFRAPVPGESGTIRAERIAEAARDHGIASLDMQALTTVTVRRSGRIVKIDEIARAVTAALQAERGTARDTEIELTVGTTEFIVESDRQAPVSVTRLTYDPSSGRFEAILSVEGSVVAQQANWKVSGGISDWIRVPVLVRAVLKGDVVNSSDITMERRRRGEIGADVGDPDQLVGLAARRPLPRGQVLRDGDVAKPELVERNTAVTMVLEQPGLKLTLRAKALQSGSQGEIVQVQNLQSKRVLDAVVIGPGRVSVGPALPARTRLTTQ